MNTKTFNVLENRAICMTKVHQYINEILPKLQNELAKGYKLTKDFTLFKKDNDKIYSIINSLLPIQKGNFPILRAYLRVNKYSMTLEVDDNYIVKYHHDGGCTVNYYKKSVFIWDITENKVVDFTPLETITKEQLENAEIELNYLKDKKQDIQDKIYQIEKLLN